MTTKRRIEQQAHRGSAKRFQPHGPENEGHNNDLGSSSDNPSESDCHVFEGPDTPMEDILMEAALPTSRVVCYGALFNVKAKVTFINRAAVSARPWSRFYTFHVVRRGACYFMTHSTETANEEFAVLDIFTTSSIDSLSDIGDIKVSGVVAHATLDTIPIKKTKKGTVIDLTINILGPEPIAQAVGDILADRSTYLQHPVFLESDVAYLNPQYYYRTGSMTDLRHLIGPAQSNSEVSRVSEAVEDVFHSLGNTEGLYEAECDVEAMSKDFLIDTTLTRHQVEGVKFIMARENPVFCQNANRNLRDRMYTKLDQQLSECLGGILADVMGLGKTLTMLTAVACSKPERYGMQNDEVTPTSTLVVLPSKQLLDVWDAEIKKRFHQDYLLVGHFHGDARPKTSAAFLKYDIVLTTYQTLASDCGGKKLLQNITWFRVVLDEAHCIRNQNTRIFKAAEALSTERRWCITGTPIQNGLHDLRSLLRFLHFDPLQRTAMFEKHIIDPIRNNSEEDQFRNLQLLLQTICIRRSKQCISLPPSVTEVVSIELTSEESEKYRQILADCQRQFEVEFCKTGVQKTWLLFTTIQKLRMLCNHGTLPVKTTTVSQTPMKKSKSRKQQRLTENESCGFCNGEDGTAALEGLDQCPLCDNWLGSSTKRSSKASDQGLCVDTLLSGASSPLSLSPSPMPMGTEHSSKLTAVTQNITLACQALKKSVVFTSWRSTLDTLKLMLSQKGINSVSIDGRVNHMDRSNTLSRFRDDPQISVLLMTMDSGAVGLTLTNASKVHLVEPHWNPAMEAQAIARVLRMGQTQNVTVFKYVTMKTVEQRIVELQEKKSRIARISLNESTKEDGSGVLDDWKFVLDPN